MTMVEVDLSNQEAGVKSKSEFCGVATTNGKANNNAEDLDLDLIKQVRELLRAQYEEASAEMTEPGKEKYSKIHYEEIMDESSPYTCWRYLLHCDKKLPETLQLMKTSLAYRQKDGVDLTKDEDFAKEFWLIAPMVVVGQDNEGNEVLYIIGRNYRKPDAIFKPIVRSFVQHLIFSWERKHRHDMSTLTMVFDVDSTGVRNIDLDFMTWLLPVRDYLPNRIKHIYVVGIPFLVRPLIRLVISWLPEKFSSITECGTFEQLVTANIPLDQLPNEAGGTNGDRYRMAPVEAMWVADSSTYSTDEMKKATHASIGYNVSPEEIDRLRALQVDYERNITDKN